MCGKMCDQLLLSSRLKYGSNVSIPFSSRSLLSFSACLSKLLSLIVLSKILSCVINRLVSWLAEPLPVAEVGEPTVEVDTDGE